MKEILILCKGNAYLSQMAEAYLHFFTQRRVNVSTAGLVISELYPLAISAMQEDNIDISDYESKVVTDFAGRHFDFLITIGDAASIVLPTTITSDAYYHFDIPNSEALIEQPLLASFSNARELVKKHILKFIGKHVEPASEARMEPF